MQTLHPTYDEQRYKLLRTVGEGGETFLSTYLYRRDREEPTNFSTRKKLTYIPAFVKIGLRQINNSISQRLHQVVRLGGSQKYTRAARGKDGGVDRHGSDMNRFISAKVLPELTMMGKVGIYIDAPGERAEDLQEDMEHMPYLYTYNVEDVRSWVVDPYQPTRFLKLLLRDFVYEYDEVGLPTELVEQYRFFELTDSGVKVAIYKDDEITETYELSLPEIPFVVASLHDSIITDACRHQISLLNLGSTDMVYAWEGNSQFLAETYDPQAPEHYFNSEEDPPNHERFVGPKRGIRVPKGVDYPKFISPSAEPLKISMEKQEQLKGQIKEMISQALRTLGSTIASDTLNKEEDGLKVIGDELAHVENRIAYFWSLYEGEEPAEIRYPINYQMLTPVERRAEAQELASLRMTIPSKSAQRKVSKQIAHILVSQNSTDIEMEEIYTEIDSLPGAIADPEQIAKLVENDIIDTRTAAIQCGFDADVAVKAEEYRVKRAEQIALAQINYAARGVNDLAVNPKDADEEKDENN